jgi:hypothetical protein
MPKLFCSLKAWMRFLMGPSDSKKINAIVCVLQTSRFQEDEVVAEKILSALDELESGCAFPTCKEDLNTA